MLSSALLFYSDTHASRDLLYLGRFECHDPFLALAWRGKKIAVLNALEFGRGLKESAFDEILSLETLQAEIRKARPDLARPGPADIAAHLAARRRIPAFTVPGDFPALVLEQLRALGLVVEVATGPVLPEREIKDAREAAAIRAGNRVAAAGFTAAEALLRRAKISGRKLLLDGRPLTSERVRLAIEIACLEAGGLALDTIVAGGDQACDPHCRGTGPLRPRELIIIDIFPRHAATGYHGDMTRTYLKGRASTEQRALVEAVAAAQKAARKVLRAGASSSAVHAECVNVFTQHGYETKSTPKGAIGFFHGTGHGLGLAVHEAPRVSAPVQEPLKLGAVVTVEPGLYYPGLGGCRIEDVAWLTESGHKLLSSHPYVWEMA
ncbi:MAG: M24 family metallopeptidase [Opitutaceae bacterium]|nr:M24 family metallopeptidase [Opitutaceae bacterium]